MVQKLIYILFTSVLLVTTTNNVAFAEMGFWKNSDKRIPLAVKAAQSSVYEMVVPGGDQGKLHMSWFLTIEDVRLWVAKRENLDLEQRLLWFKQIQKCLNEKVEICTILQGSETATAFLVGDKMTLLSVFHVFEGYNEIYPPAKNSGSGKIVVPILLKNATGQIVYGEKENEVTTANFVVGGTSFDMSALSISAPLPGEPLQLANDRKVNLNERLYSLGYPTDTDDRQKILNRPDSTGEGLWFTFGPLIKFQDAMSLAKVDTRKQTTETQKRIIESFIFVKSDSTFGMSGGPTVNRYGQVVGINRGHFPADMHASRTQFSESIRMNWVKKFLGEKIKNLEEARDIF